MRFRKIAVPAVIVAMIALTSYWLFADPELRWQEEVRLHDGRVIVVDRWEKRQASGELGHRGAPLWSEVKAKNPNTGTEVTWYEDHGSAPYVMDFVGDSAYVAAWVSFYEPCQKYGFPQRDFVFFKYDGTWKQISFEEFPRGFDTNLLVNVWNADSTGHLHKHTSLDQKAEYLRSGYKPEEYSMRSLMTKPKFLQSGCQRFGQAESR